MKKIFIRCVEFLKTNKVFVFVFIIFLFELFLRFYQIDQKNGFGYDQVDNAWAAKNIIVNHQFPLVGMVAKGNSNIYIGPAYYYFVAFFYWIFNLNPIASGVISGLTGLFSFWTIFFVVKKLFNIKVALIAVTINTFFLHAILFDRVQWPVDFIPGVSLLIFYFLYKVITGDVKKLIPLALLVGFSFSIHFTSIFFPIIIILSLPLFPRSRETLRYILISLPLFLVWLLPNIIYQLGQKSANSPFISYFNTYYHGFHLRRVMQITGDALIQFDHYSISDSLLSFKFVAFPLFFLIFLYKSIARKQLVFCYLVLLWFIVPWFIFATYKGEISDYYFSINRFVVLFILSYFVFRIWDIKNVLPKILVVALFICIIIGSFSKFISYNDSGLAEKEKAVLMKINNGEVIKFQQGGPESYLYYYLMRQRGINVY